MARPRQGVKGGSGGCGDGATGGAAELVAELRSLLDAAQREEVDLLDVEIGLLGLVESALVIEPISFCGSPPRGT